MENINADLQKRIDAGEEGLKLVEYQQVLLGITKAALANDSFPVSYTHLDVYKRQA